MRPTAPSASAIAGLVSGRSPGGARTQAPPDLVTERLVLRELRVSDAAAVAAGAGDRRVAAYLIQVPSPYPIALARRWVAHRIEWWHHGRGVTFAVTLSHEPDVLLGTVSLRRYARDRRAELGYWLAQPVWGRGLATEAARAVVDFGFRSLGLVRIYAQVLADNRASLHVLDKLGMVNEGVKRQHVHKARRLHDVVLYGLLRDEWSRRCRPSANPITTPTAAPIRTPVPSPAAATGRRSTG